MYYIITKNHIPGFHRWKDAPEQLNYLRSRHRHIFDITCKIPVDHDDREKEIIYTQNVIQDFLMGNFGCVPTMNEYNHIDIGDMSCEMLAKEIADYTGAISVTVLEDGEGGAEYVREKY